MQKQALFNLFRNLNLWSRGDQRAPHKPLLVLLALARVQAGKPRLMPFNEIDQSLKLLLQSFGRPSKSYHPEYPFWRLQNDGIWEVSDMALFSKRKSSTDALRSELIKHNAEGGFTTEIHDSLSNHKDWIVKIAKMLLIAHFPESLHADIIADTGLNMDSTDDLSYRDQAFRRNVIQAYEHRCAICGYDIKIGNTDLGLEAAHIKWRNAGGPDVVQNGLALCSFHHKALDLGAISLSDSYEILVSQEVHGATRINSLLLEYVDKRINEPQSRTYFPDKRYLCWHRLQVFRPPPRCKTPRLSLES